MRLLSPVLLGITLLAGLARAEASSTALIGADLAGWDYVGTPGTVLASVCTVRPGGIIAAAGAPSGFIATTTRYANYRLHAEWRWPGKAGNGGVLLHISPGPMDRVWPPSFQVQFKAKAVGDVLPMAGMSFAEPLTSAPGTTAIKAHTTADSERPAGEWNSCDITCRGDTIEVSINGDVQNRVTGCSLSAGRIGFQFEGTPFELRAVTLVPLD